MSDSVSFSVFADLHWREGDWAGCEARLDAVFARAARERCEFAIHCGDFCHDVAAARGLIAKAAAGPVPLRHVLGNHEFERSDSLGEVLRAFSLPRDFFSFDVRGFRFVALDTNWHRGPGGRLKHYADESEWAKCHQDEMLLPPEQVSFLAGAVATAPGPVCVFSHASFLRSPAAKGVSNGADVVALVDEARGGRPVLWFCGHYHRDALDVRGGMAFMEVNTTTSEWVEAGHDAYPAGFAAKSPFVRHSILNAVPVHAVVRLSSGGDVGIEGMRGAPFMGVTPESAGVDTTDAAGLPFSFDVLSARFRLS